MSSPAASSPSTGAQALKALRNLVGAAVILGGIYFAYANHVETSRQVKDYSKKAHDLIQRDALRDYQDAGKLLDQALALRGKDPYALAAKAEVEAILWVEHGLESHATAAREYASQATEREVNLAERFSAEALVGVAEGRAAETERSLAEVAESAATARIVAALGLVRSRLGRLDLARHDLKQAADRDWRNPRFVSLQGQVLFDSGEFASAQSAFEKAITLNPEHLASVVGKARADIAKRERVIDATRALEGVLARDESELSPITRARALTARAEALLAQGAWADAETAAREAISAAVKLDPGSAYAPFALGLALAAQKKDGAVEAIREALALNPHIARFYFNGALALAQVGRVSEGDQLFEEFQRVNSARGEKLTDAFHLARSEFYKATGNFPKAHAELDAALALNDVNAETYYRKGLLFQTEAVQPKAEKAKLFDAAREQYTKAVTVRERYPEVYRQMGLIYLDLNPKSADALDNFGKALNYYKDQKAPKQVIEEFIAEVEQRYIKAGLRTNADFWRKEAVDLAR